MTVQVGYCTNVHAGANLAQTRANLEAAGVDGAIKAMLGDAGYYSETNAADLKQRGNEAYLATERLKHHEKLALVPRGRLPKWLSAKQRMARKLRTKVGREMYAKRKGMVEPIFGQLKHVLEFRQFSMRGLTAMWGGVAADGDGGVGLAQGLQPDRQGTTVHRLRLGVFPPGREGVGQVVVPGGRAGVGLIQGLQVDRQCAAVPRLRRRR